MLARRGSILTETQLATTLQLFYLADNGVTVLCPEAEVGDTGEVNGVLYTKRDRDGLLALVATNSADLVTSCTSGVTSMSFMFLVRDPPSRLLMPLRCCFIIARTLAWISPLTPRHHASPAVL